MTPMLSGVHLSLLAAPSLEGDRLSVRRLDGLLQVIDDFRIDRISVGDHQGHHLECYSALGYMAARTRTVRLGPCVTNASARVAGIHAAALASLDALSGGRAFGVFGSGDGIVRNLGIRAQSVGETRDSLLDIRGLLHDGARTIDGRRVQMAWPQDTSGRISLGIAAGGPRMLDVAAEVADDVYASFGVTPELVAGARHALSVRANAHGRQAVPTMWWVTPFAVAEKRSEAVDIVGESLSTIANHSLRGATYESRSVPPSLWPTLRTFHDGYDWSAKNAPAAERSNAALMNQLGLTEYFLSRFAVAGDPDDVVKRLQALAGWGVDRVMLKVNTREELELLGRHVLPQVLRFA